MRIVNISKNIVLSNISEKVFANDSELCIDVYEIQYFDTYQQLLTKLFFIYFFRGLTKQGYQCKGQYIGIKYFKKLALKIGEKCLRSKEKVIFPTVMILNV